MSMVRETRPRMAAAGKRETILDGQRISYVIKLSPRAKYARLEVRPQTGLAVVVPRSYEFSRITDLLNEKRRWILDKLAKFGHINSPSIGAGVKSDDTIPYLGPSCAWSGGKIAVRPTVYRWKGESW